MSTKYHKHIKQTGTLQTQRYDYHYCPVILASRNKKISHCRLVTSSQPTPPINAVVFAATTASRSPCSFRSLHPDPQSSAKFTRCYARCKRSSNFPLMRCPPQRRKACAYHTFTSETCHCFIAATPPYSVCIWGNSLQNAVATFKR